MATSRANLVTTVSADITPFAASMRRAGVVAETTGSKISRAMRGAALAYGTMAAAAGVATLSAAVIFGSKAFIEGLKRAADLGGEISDLSGRTGIAAGELALLSRAFEDNGVSADKIGTVINKLQKFIVEFGEGSTTAEAAFSDLGVSFNEIDRLAPEKQFALIQKRISEISSPAKRAALAMKIFGKSGGELLTLFSDRGAMINANIFLGTAAEILNRRANDFAEMSGILARAGEKFDGLFVGSLDILVDDIIPILRDWEKMDFAKIGQAIGPDILAAAKGLADIFDKIERTNRLIFYTVAMTSDIIKEIVTFQVGKNIVDFVKDKIAGRETGLDFYKKMLGSAFSGNSLAGLQRSAFLQSSAPALSTTSPGSISGGIASPAFTAGIERMNGGGSSGMRTDTLMAAAQRAANMHLSRIETTIGQALTVN